MRIGFIGAGRVGKALGLWFCAHGLDVRGYYSRTAASAEAAAALCGAAAFQSLEALTAGCDVLFVTTPDGVIRQIDAAAAGLKGRAAESRVWLHVSGALPSTELALLSKAGCAVGSMHPLQSFGDPTQSAARLNDSYFTIEGTQTARETMREILQHCGARFDEIETASKPLYHAGACVLSNYLVTLLDSGFTLLRAAGLSEDTLYDAAMPLIEGTLQNVRDRGAVDALTGPIARGDAETVGVHLAAMDGPLPAQAALYRSLGTATVEMIEGKKLSREKAEELKYRLRGGNYGEEIHS